MRTKLSPKIVVDDGSPDKDPFDASGEVLRRSLTRMEHTQAMVFEGIRKGFIDPSCLKDLAGVSRALATTTSEIRQRERHTKLKMSKMTDAQRDEAMKSYIADLPKDRRDALRKMIDELDSQENVLGLQ